MLTTRRARPRPEYGVTLPPWKQRTDDEDCDHLSMPAEIASILRDEAGT